MGMDREISRQQCRNALDKLESSIREVVFDPSVQQDVASLACWLTETNEGNAHSLAEKMSPSMLAFVFDAALCTMTRFKLEDYDAS